MTDLTFTSIARRAAEYPVIMRRGQIPPMKAKKENYLPARGAGSLEWLLLNTLEVNRVLANAPSRKT
jgi:hypothetical protein